MIVCDIETGPLPEDQLRTIFTPPTYEDFAATCDQRWKSETVAAKFADLEAAAWPKFVEKAALSPVTGQVLVIGYLSTDTDAIVLASHPREADVLAEFWLQLSRFRKSKRPIIGHNFKKFDAPFLVGRSWILGVDVPPWVIERGRYVNDQCVIDTMDLWSVVSGSPYISLGRMAEIFGVGEKTGDEEVTGATFHEFWYGDESQRSLAVEYLKKDLQLTADIASRMGIV